MGILNFIIGVTSIKIEHDHCAWERSLNASSTASTVDVAFIPLHPTTTTTSELARNCGQLPTCAPPLSRGMWAGASILAVDGGIRVGGTAGGTQEVGGPPGASQQRATTFVVACFHLPLTLSPPPPSRARARWRW